MKRGNREKNENAFKRLSNAFVFSYSPFHQQGHKLVIAKNSRIVPNRPVHAKETGACRKWKFRPRESGSHIDIELCRSYSGSRNLQEVACILIKPSNAMINRCVQHEKRYPYLWHDPSSLVYGHKKIRRSTFFNDNARVMCIWRNFLWSALLYHHDHVTRWDFISNEALFSLYTIFVATYALKNPISKYRRYWVSWPSLDMKMSYQSYLGFVILCSSRWLTVEVSAR